MPKDGFGPGTVVNRRVNKHIKTLIPRTIHQHKDYHLEGQRAVPPTQIPGKADTCFCYLEVYVGTEGQFAVHQERRFDHDTDGEWRCRNEICRTDSERSPREPFTYTVETTITLCGRSQTDRSHVSWSTLGDDPIYGSLEAQAATLLAEKMAHSKAVENGHRDHCGSLSRLGSLSNVIDSGRYLVVEWEEVDALLGPEADTIAASAGFDPLSGEQRSKAEEKSIDFLTDDLNEELALFEGPKGRSHKAANSGTGRDESSESWKTLPEGMSQTEAEEALSDMQERLAAIRKDLCEDP